MSLPNKTTIIVAIIKKGPKGTRDERFSFLLASAGKMYKHPSSEAKNNIKNA